MRQLILIAICITLIISAGIFLQVSAEDVKAVTNQASGNTENKEVKKNPENKTENNANGNNTSPVIQKQALGFFHTVNLNGVGDLHISQGDQSDFTIEAEPKILPLIQAQVKDQILTIDMKDASLHSQAKVNYYLKIKTLKAVNAYSAATITIEGLETKVFSIALLSGFGEAHLKLDVTKLTSKISGAGKMDIEGVADEHELYIDGVGEFSGNKLKSKLTTVNISGSGIAKLNVSEDLIVKIRGNGSVGYCGTPNITKEIIGNGTITALDPNQCSE